VSLLGPKAAARALCLVPLPLRPTAHAVRLLSAHQCVYTAREPRHSSAKPTTQASRPSRYICSHGMNASRCLIGLTSGHFRRPPMECVAFLVAVHPRLLTLPNALPSARTTATLCCHATVGIASTSRHGSWPGGGQRIQFFVSLGGRRGVPLPLAIKQSTGTTSSCFVRRSCDPAPRCPWTSRHWRRKESLAQESLESSVPSCPALCL